MPKDDTAARRGRDPRGQGRSCQDELPVGFDGLFEEPGGAQGGGSEHGRFTFLIKGGGLRGRRVIQPCDTIGGEAREREDRLTQA